MHIRFSHFLCILLALCFSACAELTESFGTLFDTGEQKASQEQEEVVHPTKFKILEIQSPQISFYDFATITYKKQSTKLALYKLGKVIGDITINPSSICFNNDCLGKWNAAKNFFGAVSYGDLFEDIIFARDIFDGEGKGIAPNGAMVQWFVKSGQEIYYERSDSYTLFHNRSNGVIVGIQSYSVKNKAK
ncbi:hypothetical protein [Helicobacter sp. TUL]|uniref:HP0838 family lipoprotein n=1 Tax=Helicobacter sp. TUL TaxID=1848928 RepID=UPI000BABC0D9|nr:hypothetical protein [Helicobacter sp. TUL]PAU99543.1 hypothetical protein B9T66_06950 [Helicobacter sp. TUL]